MKKAIERVRMSIAVASNRLPITFVIVTLIIGFILGRM